MHLNASHPDFRRRSRGFTLIELLIAMFILAIGIVSIAGLFPVAGSMQKSTFESVIAKHAYRDARAYIDGIALDETDLITGLTGGYDTSGELERFRAGFYSGGAPTLPLGDRGYPSTATDTAKRDAFWVPMARDADTEAGTREFHLYIFVLIRDKDATFTDRNGAANQHDPDYVPVVRSANIRVDDANRFEFDAGGFNDTNNDGFADQVTKGDWVVDNKGVIYTVNNADADGFTIHGTIPTEDGDPTEIWYAPPPSANRASPLRGVAIIPIGSP